ncbi:MAG: hypothetical protein ACSHYF_08045 [Verrucomicrobiaceae bacterium]
MCRSLILTSLLITTALGDTVIWTASGTITNRTGVFLNEAYPNGTPVTLSMSYSDFAESDGLGGAVGQNDVDYLRNLDLKINISIADSLWAGSIFSGISGAPYTLFVRTNQFPIPERFEPALHQSEGATFSSFPLSAGESNDTISLKFGGPNTFMDFGIWVRGFSIDQIDSATGTIMTGGFDNQLTFTLEPSSITITDTPAIVPLAPTIQSGFDGTNILLNWPSQDGVAYHLERTTDLASGSWTPVETISGDGTVLTASIPKQSENTFFRIIANLNEG